MKQKHTKISTNKSTHSEMGPVWQNPIQRTVRTAHLSVLSRDMRNWACTTAPINTAQNSSVNLPSYLPRSHRCSVGSHTFTASGDAV